MIYFKYKKKCLLSDVRGRVTAIVLHGNTASAGMFE